MISQGEVGVMLNVRLTLTVWRRHLAKLSAEQSSSRAYPTWPLATCLSPLLNNVSKSGLHTTSQCGSKSKSFFNAKKSGPEQDKAKVSKKDAIALAKAAKKVEEEKLAVRMVEREERIAARRAKREEEGLVPVKNSSKTEITAEESENVTKEVVVLPLIVEEKFRLWAQLLQHEIDERAKQINTLLRSGSVEELIASGAVLGDLRHSTTSRGMVQFSRPANAYIPRTTLEPGTPVRLVDAKNYKVALCEAVLDSVERSSVTLNIQPEEYQKLHKKTLSNSTFVVLPSIRHPTYERLINRFSSKSGTSAVGPGGDLLLTAFGAKEFPVVESDLMPTEWFHELNDSQKEAVAVALNPQRPMVTIQGPPGTGKTFVVAEIIRQCAVRGQKVLVCAPSHVAVDNIIDRVKGKVKLVRLGTGVSESSQAFSFDAMVKQGSHAQDHQKAYETLQKLRESNAERNLLASVQSSVAAIATKARREVLNDAQAIFCTITSSMIEMLIALNIQPDVVIIDEAAQAIEPTSWLPLLAGKRCVLAGDQCQLPPIVMSQLAKDGRLHLSLMERLSAQFASISRLLTVQYRMHEKIMEWSSGYFYGGKLTAAASVGRATLSQISQVPDESIHNSPLLFIDTTGYKNGEMREVKSQGGTSSGNPGEARLVAAYLSKLIACGVKQQDIGIITPYVFQVALIKQLVNERYPDVMVDTVDSFQGQERQVIILSLVRSNPKRIVGFLNDDRRMNVSVTRAKRHLVMIGDSRTVVRSDAIAELIDVVSKSGKVQRASEYEADLQLINFSDSEVKKISSKVVGSEREALLETDSVDDAVGNRRSADAARRAVKM